MKCYRKTISHGLTVLKWAEDMEKWYGIDENNIDHFITHFGFDENKPVVWNSVVYLHGRYVMTMQVKVRVNYEKCEIVGPVGGMSFFVHEITKVNVIASGQVSAKRGAQEKFSSSEWTLLDKGGGDLGALPMPILKSSPTPGFEKFQKSWQKDL